MATQAEKAAAFRDLHQTGTFIIPNPWDAGSARLLAGMGFKALATTSAGHAFALGRPDGAGAVSREETLANARAIVEATELPVSADLENGFGDSPEACAQTIRAAAAAGLVGGSIEDATGREDDPIYPFDAAVARMKAAVAAARALPFPFMLVGRAENFLHGRPDLDDTIRRLQAFAELGADVLYAPRLKSRDEIAAVVKAVAPKPINVLAVAGSLSRDELAALGVRRISVGGAFARAALDGFLHAATEVATHGTFGFLERTITNARLNETFGG